MRKTKRWAAWAMAVLCLALGACATTPEPFAYAPANELKPGPGLFSGQDGVLTLYGKPKPLESETDENAPQGQDPEPGSHKDP